MNTFTLGLIGIVLMTGGILLGLANKRTQNKKDEAYYQDVKVKLEELRKQRGDTEFHKAADDFMQHLKEDDPKRAQTMAEYVKQLEKRNAERQSHQQQVLAKWGLENGGIEEARKEANARNYRGGKYHSNPKAQYGSVDNPEVVGMPDCSDDLRFSMEREHWVLTDGMGNGWSR